MTSMRVFDAAAALAELGLEQGHRLAVLLADRLAQVVGLGAGEARHGLGDLHGLLLVQDHAIGRADDRLQPLVGHRDRVGVALAPRIGRDLVHRARAVQRDQRDEVVELGRLDLAQGALHALRLELEDPDRVAAGHHLVGLLIVERQVRHVRPLAAGALDDVQRVLDDVEVAQAQEVHLQQAELLDGLHRELGDEPVVALAVAVAAAGIGQLQRHDVGERASGDDDRGGVDRRVAHDPLQAPRDVDDLLGRGVGVVGAAQRLAGTQAALEGRVATLLGVRDQLGQAVAHAVVVAEHARGVAGGRAREHLAERDDLRDGLAAVLGDDVLHDALAPADREVDVDIGHRHALGIQEALEEQVVAQRIDVGDAAACRRRSSRRRCRVPGPTAMPLSLAHLTKSQTMRK